MSYDSSDDDNYENDSGWADLYNYDSRQTYVMTDPDSDPSPRYSDDEKGDLHSDSEEFIYTHPKWASDMTILDIFNFLEEQLYQLDQLHTGRVYQWDDENLITARLYQVPIIKKSILAFFTDDIIAMLTDKQKVEIYNMLNRMKGTTCHYDLEEYVQKAVNGLYEDNVSILENVLIPTMTKLLNMLLDDTMDDMSVTLLVMFGTLRKFNAVFPELNDTDDDMIHMIKRLVETLFRLPGVLLGWDSSDIRHMKKIQNKFITLFEEILARSKAYIESHKLATILLLDSYDDPIYDRQNIIKDVLKFYKK